jgi:hypothetical protein
MVQPVQELGLPPRQSVNTSVIKSVQRGVAAGAGSVTINAVNMAKSLVISVSKGSAGTVAATGSLSLTPSGGGPSSNGSSGANFTAGTPNFPTYSGSLTGGTTSLTTSQYSAKLTAATTLTVDGACEWQVLEYY